MYKLSHYLVPVGLKEEGVEKTLIYSTRSNTLKVMDSALWMLLKRGDFQRLPEGTREMLVKDVILVEQTEDELQTILRENQEAIDGSNHLYFVIQPTAACPLGCGYCGQKHENKHMKKDIQQATLGHLSKKLAQKKWKSLSITWFGAEPLSGFSVIRSLSPQILALAKSYQRPYHAKIVTNGFLLERHIVQELIEEHKVTDYEITLDGIALYHDTRRHTKAMGPSFEKIYGRLKMLAQFSQARITLRSNVDSRNKEGITPLLEMLAKDGLEKRINFYVAPLHSWGNDAHLLSAEKKEFSQWEIEWLIDMQKLGFSISLLPKRTHSVCFATNPEYELVDPEGGIYGCSEVSLVPTYIKNGKNVHEVGHILDDAPYSSEKRQNFLDFYKPETLSRFQCFQCRMLPTCGGGCPKEWEEGRVPCPSPKFNIEQRMVLSYIKKNHVTVQGGY